jgi:hypothetical protein
VTFIIIITTTIIIIFKCILISMMVCWYWPLLQVLYYLARIEPFTTLHIQLQGGKFGDDDHMLSDITRTWNSVLEDMNDVKELVSSDKNVLLHSSYTHHLLQKSS